MRYLIQANPKAFKKRGIMSKMLSYEDKKKIELFKKWSKQFNNFNKVGKNEPCILLFARILKRSKFDGIIRDAKIVA